MPIHKIQKRTGDIVDFDQNRISHAIIKAVDSIENFELSDTQLPHKLALQILNELEQHFFSSNRVPTVEDVQNLVEEKLVEYNCFEVAKSYILYRASRTKIRARKRLFELEQLDQNKVRVKKDNGQQVAYSQAKLENTWAIAAKGLEQTCTFEELINVFNITLTDGLDTSQILQNLRKAALDLISVENANWQLVAGRLFTVEFYKKACRSRKLQMQDIYSPEAWMVHLDDYIQKGLYSSKFKEAYTDEQLLKAGSWIDKQRDMEYGYTTTLAFAKRYLLNPNKKFHELPQEMYLAVALFLAIPEKPEQRMQVARQIYEVTSRQELSLPTPTLLNARTNFHQLSSCFKLNVDDDLRSIYHNIENMAQISKFGGGVGVYMGHIRSKGACIRGVNNASGGVIPWVRVINDTACAVNQLGARLGAISPTIDIWHRDIHDFLEMQTETGDIRAKAFDVFPAIAVPDLFMKRVRQDDTWTLFDPHEIRKVTGKSLEDMFSDEFEDFYLQCEANQALTLKESVSAKKLMKVFMQTAVETGMPYIFFRDTVNRLNPNKHAGNIYSTQLCTEICQNTSISKFVSETVEGDDIVLKYKAGDSVVCNLASINVAKVNTKQDIERVFPIAMRVLDNVITLNYYPIEESKVTSLKYRAIGLGFLGLAEYLACNKLAYDSPQAREHTDKLFEQYAYSGLQASNQLAQERGAYELFKGSQWNKGVLFGRDQEWFKKNAKTDNDWQQLISEIKEHGTRFSYHFAPAPNTSTAGVVGTTAGLLPIYKKFFIETNVIAPTVTVAPNLNQENFWYYKEYKNMQMPEVIKMISTIYKWIDQSISFEWMMDPDKTSPADLFEWYFQAWESGVKTIYYLRSLSGEIKEDCISCSG
jgi:ribonucleoside-diphosphate reductase alpha chain